MNSAFLPLRFALSRNHFFSPQKIGGLTGPYLTRQIATSGTSDRKRYLDCGSFPVVMSNFFIGTYCASTPKHRDYRFRRPFSVSLPDNKEFDKVAASSNKDDSAVIPPDAMRIMDNVNNGPENYVDKFSSKPRPVFPHKDANPAADKKRKGYGLALCGLFLISVKYLLVTPDSTNVHWVFNALGGVCLLVGIFVVIV